MFLFDYFISTLTWDTQSDDDNTINQLFVFEAHESTEQNVIHLF